MIPLRGIPRKTMSRVVANGLCKKDPKINAKRRLRGGITAIECRHGSVYVVER